MIITDQNLYLAFFRGYKMEPNVNPNTVIPMYEQVINVIKDEIQRGVFKPQSKIPTEPELSERFGVSRITIRRAIEELCKQGIVEKKQGKGTFVTASKFVRNMDQAPMSFTEVCRANGTKAAAKIIEAGIVTPEDPYVINTLGLKPGENAVRIFRLRYAGDEPLVLEDNYFPMEYSYLLGIDLENDSLYRYLREEKHIELQRSNTRVRIIKADAKLAKILGVPKNSPQLEMSGYVTNFADGKVVHTSYRVGFGESFELIV